MVARRTPMPRRRSNVPHCRSAVPPCAAASSCSLQLCGRRCSLIPAAPPRAALPAPQPSSGRVVPHHSLPLLPRPDPATRSTSTAFTPCAPRNDNVLVGKRRGAARRAVRPAVWRGPRACRRRAPAGFAAISDAMTHILVQSCSTKEYFRLEELRCSFILSRLYKLAALNS